MTLSVYQSVYPFCSKSYPLPCPYHQCNGYQQVIKRFRRILFLHWSDWSWSHPAPRRGTTNGVRTVFHSSSQSTTPVHRPTRTTRRGAEKERASYLVIDGAKLFRPHFCARSRGREGRERSPSSLTRRTLGDSRRTLRSSLVNAQRFVARVARRLRLLDRGYHPLHSHHTSKTAKEVPPCSMATAKEVDAVPA